MIYPAQWSWRVLLDEILKCGHRCQAQDSAGSSGRGSVELLAHRSVVDMSYPVVLCPGRKLGYKFQAGEAWWILDGRDDVESISRYSSKVAKYSDDGVKFFGAYGTMLDEQVDGVVDRLRRDPHTRQAVVQVWRKNPPQSKDIPCTLSWQFLLRDGKIHLVATMRSSDAWLGWPYDVFNFSCVATYVALHLEPVPDLGRLYLTCGSQHLYDSEVGAAGGLPPYQHSDDYGPLLDPLRFRHPTEFVEFLKTAADTVGSLAAMRMRS